MYFIPLYFISLYFISLYISHFTLSHFTYLTLHISQYTHTIHISLYQLLAATIPRSRNGACNCLCEQKALPAHVLTLHAWAASELCVCVLPQLCNSFRITWTPQLANSFMILCACIPAVQQLPNTCTYMYTSAVQQLSYYMCIPAGNQLCVYVCWKCMCVRVCVCVYVCACLTMPSTHVPKHKMLCSPAIS